ncbi:MAG: hypothetical protein ABI823_08995, partial [Bryobacteraceae bacterium]
PAALSGQPSNAAPITQQGSYAVFSAGLQLISVGVAGSGFAMFMELCGGAGPGSRPSPSGQTRRVALTPVASCRIAVEEGGAAVRCRPPPGSA